MKTIALSHDQVTIVSDEDYEELSKYNWFAYRIAGMGKNKKTYLYGYKAGFKKKREDRPGYDKVWLHNFLMNPEPGMVVDHINGDPLDNRRENLRIATKRENSLNRGRRSSNKTSQYLGVCKRKSKSKFSAQILLNGKTKHLGFFDTEEEAALAYNNAAAEMFGKFARLNEIKPKTGA